MTYQSIHDTECRQTIRNRRFTENALRWRKPTNCSTHRYITNWIDMSVEYVLKQWALYFLLKPNLGKKKSCGFQRTTGLLFNNYISRLHQSIAGTQVLMNLILRGVWNLSLWIYNIFPSHNSFPNFTKILFKPFAYCIPADGYHRWTALVKLYHVDLGRWCACADHHG
jgi:hypothetical protein